MPSKFKTKPFKHQLEALRRCAGKEFFALLMEQGTGKSKVVIDDVAGLRRDHKIDTMLIIAPKGVAPAWLKEQLPTHMPDDIAYVAALWKQKGGRSKRASRALAAALDEKEALRTFIMNVEAFGASAEALDFAIDILDSAESALVVIDESHRIKTPGAHTTKRCLNLRKRAAYRRIMTGTIADKPFDVFSQFGFLSPAILGTDSFTAFKAEYAELVPDTSGLMRHIAMRIPKVWRGQYIDDFTGQPANGAMNADGTARKKHMEPAYLPTIVAKNDDGTPRYRNLAQLAELIAPHSYRVLKRDCLDLPDKLYNRYYTYLSDEQQALYDEIAETHRVEWESGAVSTFSRLTTYLRLQQVLCGYIPAPEDGEPLRNLFPTWDVNPRIVSTLNCIEDRPEGEGTIIWCRFIEDIRRVTEALRSSYGAGSVVQFYGDVKERDRDEAVARFMGVRKIMGKSGNLLREEEVPTAERARFMIAQQRAGGVGQTWTAANLSFHYSNTFSYIDRIQAEDRPHRIGQHRPVQYIDLEAEDTIDTIIIDSMRGKKDVADVINKDEAKPWL